MSATSSSSSSALNALYPDCDFGPGRNIGIVAHDPESEGLGAKRGRRANPTEADHPERSAPQPAHERRPRAVEPANRIPNEIFMKADDAASEREHQCDRMIRDFARPVVRRIAHWDSGAARGFQVDVIEADAGPHNHPAFWNFGDKAGVNRHLMPRYNSVRPRESIDGKPVDVAFPADCPVDIRSSGPPLDLGIVGILRIGREEMETQRHFAPGSPTACAERLAARRPFRFSQRDSRE